MANRRWDIFVSSEDRDGKKHYTKIGVAFEGEAKGQPVLSLKLEALPPLGEAVGFLPKPKDNRGGRG